MSKQNRLSKESSLYLQQHADNPVDWYPWGEEALTKAQQENKVILLSIGYSACHWCHVMARESFSDLETAALMNSHFINIKVDKEERPDLDKLYQLAYQLMNGQGGGWPLTVFLAPYDHIPIFIGTYFPPVESYGRISFKELLTRIATVYDEKPVEIQVSKNNLLQTLRELTEIATVPKTIKFTDEPFLIAQKRLDQEFDAQNGGFGIEPKFPHPDYLERLLRFYALDSNEAISSLNKVIFTLTKIANSGLYDHIGGGFFRYSVDKAWEIPHFEKMLYDNAQLLSIYSEAYAIHPNELFARVITETADWLLREMQSPQGGFYATLDADSAHVEGKYYYWDYEEIKLILTADEFNIVRLCYGLGNIANFKSHWHLQQIYSVTEAAEHLGIPEKQLAEELASAKQKLFTVRQQKEYPARNEKIITAWNALAIKGLCQAGLYLQRPQYIAAAEKTLEYLRKLTWHNNQLYANVQNQQRGNVAFVDDYAFLLESILFLLQARWQTETLDFACQLADNLLYLYQDEIHGGFYFSAATSEKLIVRPKYYMDEAIPAGNAIAAIALNRLGLLLGNTKYLQAVENLLKNAWADIEKYPLAHCNLLNALEEYTDLFTIVIIRGDGETAQQWFHAVTQSFHPQRMVFVIPTQEKQLPQALQDKVAEPNQVVAYVCKGQECLPPVKNLPQLLDAVNGLI